MKTLKSIGSMVMLGAICAGALAAFAADTNTTKTTEKLKPYTLATCIVSGEKLGEMGKPVVFVYQGQEVKLCCSGCKKDFDKDPAKYLKKIQDAAAAKK
jgi:YHS domain-containing protein